MTAQPLQSGFRDSVRQAQAVFRAVMMAMARPGTIEPLPANLAPPAPLVAELAAVALSLCDHETALWLDVRLAASPAVVDFLRFHTGTRIAEEASAASFALVSDPTAMPALARFAQGTDEFPDRSTTLIIAARSMTSTSGLLLDGPGIKATTRLQLDPLPPEFVAQRAANHSLFPRGVDCIFVAPGKVAALPRSTRVRGG